MKLRVAFKTPDAVYEALKHAMAAPGVEDHPETPEMKELIKQFVQYGECLTVEFDTEDKTATVIPV